jgi:hypothetical protein
VPARSATITSFVGPAATSPRTRVADDGIVALHATVPLGAPQTSPPTLPLDEEVDVAVVPDVEDDVVVLDVDDVLVEEVVAAPPIPPVPVEEVVAAPPVPPPLLLEEAAPVEVDPDPPEEDDEAEGVPVLECDPQPAIAIAAREAQSPEPGESKERESKAMTCGPSARQAIRARSAVQAHGARARAPGL